MNLSPNYLSDFLKIHTGRNTKEHIYEKLTSKAKEKLSATSLSVSEIAYDLGFEHPQSFSTFFKKERIWLLWNFVKKLKIIRIKIAKQFTRNQRFAISICKYSRIKLV